MINERIKKRLVKDRFMTSVTFDMPKDVLDDLEDMALCLGFSEHQSLIRSYISEGMRHDEEKIYFASKGKDAASLEEPAIIEDVLVDASFMDTSDSLRVVG
uniref:Uncharacterized protein n=1 Tax=Candidatus Kentrum sp. MB TaxID=2138164 RepID=A0A451BBC2_9GAMM|nr:MAG: hypothetical protein BECKMB1821G_GA0114241_103127 [Candidatus Kentron sp. MB]VFK31791.1 MAG: hypothetical protein BECKMB1821I_GA0114274_10278 [Candidatus Kentron sp. MB]VFK75565.1 MAG: hypothetical protein BECKMB1821H_GA0114242_10268 [Candidatus Kentron sp. MB]